MKNVLIKYWSIVLLIFGTVGSHAQILKPVKWEMSAVKISEDSYDLTYTAKIDNGWTVYSMFVDEDAGPLPTFIEYESKDGIEFIGDPVEEGHKKEGKDALFDDNLVIKFLSDEDYIIKQRVKLLQPQATVQGYLTFMTCNDVKCLPPTDNEFSFDLIKGPLLNKTNESDTKTQLKSENSNPSGFLENMSDGNVIDQIRPNIVASLENPRGQCGGTTHKSSSMWWMFVLGFLGGLVALLTPCVFPMIPLTVSFFTKDTKRKGWVNGLIYGLSIIVIYVTIGLLLTAVFGEEALNRLSTNWIANTIFFIIFILFAFSFFGFYEITLPSSWSTKSDHMADKGGLIGMFFMAFTLSLVSFSCTGPIIGTAIVQAASNQVGPFVVMFGFSLALAIPFGIFAAFPAWLNTLPRSGSWMNSVKVVLGFLELALAFKFLSVADLTNHWGLLKYEVFMGIWVIIFAGLTAYLFGFIKFPHDSPPKTRSLPRMIFAIASLAFTVYLATGFMYNDTTKSYQSLKLMSGLAPPANYNFLLPEIEVDHDIKSKYVSYTKCANNIDCFKDYYEGLDYARSQNKPVFLDHTGHGCVNCRKVEEHIWVDEEVRAMLNNDFVMISLYVDDDEKLDQTLISKSRDTKIRNVGNKWADFQIVNFQQNSQPLYVMMTPDEEVLALPRGYQEGTTEYLAFLKCGLEAFHNSSK